MESKIFMKVLKMANSYRLILNWNVLTIEVSQVIIADFMYSLILNLETVAIK